MRDTIAHYRLLDEIGTGATGTVYRARDTRAGRTVAVKVLNEAVSRDPARRARFLADARSAAAVSHPNIAALYEVGDEPDHLYLVSEFVRGEPLATVINGRPINPRRAVDLGAQLADALAHAHGHGMSHGDLHPGNIIVTPKGSAKIMQPGFAAWAGDPAASRAAADPPDPDDIRALGAVLFEMLTGVPPSRAAADGVAPDGQGVPRATALNRSLPAEVDRLTAGLLAADPRGRFQSAAVAAAELRALGATLEERSAVQDRPVPVTGPAQPGSRASAYLWIVVTAGLGVAAAILWLSGGS